MIIAEKINEPNDNVTLEYEPHKVETEDYTIINSCCIKGLTKMKNEKKKIHLTITSPPILQC